MINPYNTNLLDYYSRFFFSFLMFFTASINKHLITKNLDSDECYTINVKLNEWTEQFEKLMELFTPHGKNAPMRLEHPSGTQEGEGSRAPNVMLYFLIFDENTRRFSNFMVDSIGQLYSEKEITKDEYIALNEALQEWLKQYEKISLVYQHYIQGFPVHFEIYPGLPKKKKGGSK